MKRGRKTALSVVPDIAPLPQRPAPPAHFKGRLRDLWAEIVDDWPADHWRPSDLKLLEDLVITEQYVIDCDMIIEQLGHVIDGANGRVVSNPAVMQRRGHIQTIATIQRALRLCPSTRMRAENSVLRSRPAVESTTGRVKRPWESK